MIIEWDADCVDDYGGIPEPGDIIEHDIEGKLLILRTMIINNSKVEMKVRPVTEEIMFFEEPSDASTTWREIDEQYLDNSGNTNFLDTGLTPNE